MAIMIFGIEYEMLWNWIFLLIGVFLIVDIWMRGADDYEGWRQRDDD